jgi:hypothetical protein
MAVELATAYISLVPSAKGMGAKVAKELGSAGVEDVAQKTGDNAGRKMGASIAAGIIGGTSGVAAISKSFDFLGGAIADASNMNETVSKARTIFGQSSPAIEKWASTAAKSIGQSKQQALDAAGTFGNMFTQLGIGSDQAAQMSIQMTGLASDFASFLNADISDVIDAQQAAFRGEYDALQRFVPTINAAAVEQEALRMTGKKSTKELTLQEKALATNSLMMKGAGDAAGDFARTSDGLANKQRIQAAQWADLRAKIGSGLLPVITKLTGFLINDVVPVMSSLTSFVSHNKSVFVALGIGIAAVLVPAFIAWVTAAAPAAAATLLAIAPAVALGAAVAAMAYLIIKNWDTIKHAVGVAVDFVKGLISGLIDAFKKIPGWISTALSKVADIITAPYRAAFTAIATLWNKTIGKLHVHIPSIHLGPFKTPGVDFSVPDIPTLHDGGIFRAPRGQTEGLALLQHGERVLPANATPTGNGTIINVDARGIEPAPAVGEYVSRFVGWKLSLVGGD